MPVLLHGLARCDGYVLHPKQVSRLGGDLVDIDYRSTSDSWKRSFPDARWYLHTYDCPGLVPKELERDFPGCLLEIEPIESCCYLATKLKTRQLNYLHGMLRVLKKYLQDVEVRSRPGATLSERVVVGRYDLYFLPEVRDALLGTELLREPVFAVRTPEGTYDSSLFSIMRYDVPNLVSNLENELENFDKIDRAIGRFVASSFGRPKVLCEGRSFANTIYRIARTNLRADRKTTLIQKVSQSFTENQKAMVALRTMGAEVSTSALEKLSKKLAGKIGLELDYLRECCGTWEDARNSAPPNSDQDARNSAPPNSDQDARNSAPPNSDQDARNSAPPNSDQNRMSNPSKSELHRTAKRGKEFVFDRRPKKKNVGTGVLLVRKKRVGKTLDLLAPPSEQSEEDDKMPAQTDPKPADATPNYGRLAEEAKAHPPVEVKELEPEPEPDSEPDPELGSYQSANQDKTDLLAIEVVLQPENELIQALLASAPNENNQIQFLQDDDDLVAYLANCDLPVEREGRELSEASGMQSVGRDSQLNPDEVISEFLEYNRLMGVG
ncbi:MAG: hypothetical protein ACYCOU_03175 [Sulfobacillus sp.]